MTSAEHSLPSQLSQGEGGLAIVTGASRGLGHAVVLGFLQRGISVLGVSRRAPLIELPEVKTNGVGAAKYTHCTADVTSSADVARIVAQVKEIGQPLIALVNNAGIIEPMAKLASVDLDHWRACFDVNVVAVVALTQAVLPMLRMAGGRIINVSTGVSLKAMEGWAAYCASKAALNMVTKSIAIEEPLVVAVAVRPGCIDTDMQAAIRAEGQRGMAFDVFERFKNMHDSGALLPPQLPAQAIVRLALEAPRSMSGELVSWDSV